MDKKKRDGIRLSHSDKVFFFHRGNDAFVRGERAKPAHYGGSGWVFLAQVFCVLAGIAVAAFAAYEGYRFFLLSTERAETWGEYADRRIYTDDEGDSTYYVSYRYSVDAINYRNESRVSSELYNSAPSSGALRVYYARSQPSISSLMLPNIILPLFLVAFAVVWNFIAFSLIVGLVIRVRKRAELLRSGRILQGEVVHADSELDDDNDYSLKVTYGFSSPETRTWLEKQESKLDNALRHTPLPIVGTPVFVFYANDDNHEVL